MAHYYQMAKAGRDQTETLEAIKEFDIFFERYPNSALMTEARRSTARRRIASATPSTSSASPTTA